MPRMVFLENTRVLSQEKYQILMELRRKVFIFNPNVEERMRYGGILLSTKRIIGEFFVYSNHISFEFSQG